MNPPPLPTTYAWNQLYSPGSPQNISGGPPKYIVDTPSELFTAPIFIPGNSKPHVNLGEMSGRLPDIYGQLSQNANALSCLKQVVTILKAGFWPESHHLNGLVAQYFNEFRCILPNCEKHVNGFDREDRAREHFVIAHLGGAYQCPLWLVLLRLYEG
jgi:hypothetical protein